MKQKENTYYDGFVTCMGYACEAAAYLREVLNDYNPAVLETKLIEMHKIEHGADLCKHDLMEKLAREFITPIEREDIMALLQQIDDVTDSIEDLVRKLYMYNVTALRPEMHEFADIISQCCVVTREALKELYHFQKSETLRASIIKVNELEELGDRLHVNAIRRLYTEEIPPRERMTWTVIFDLLEGCCDVCEDVTDSLEMVMMKNS